MGESREQVEAFIEILKERLDLDESKIAKIAAVAQRNGRNYAIWAWAFTLMLGLIGFLATRQLDSIVLEIAEIRQRQSDVRERLRVLEELYRTHAQQK